MTFVILRYYVIRKTSKKSFIILMLITINRGPKITGLPSVMLIDGTICIKPIIKKYAFASFEN